MTGPALAPVPEYPRRLVYLGTPSMAVRPLEALVQGGFDVALVVTGEDKRRGRGSTLLPSAVKEAALALGVPVSHRVEDALAVDADLGVVVAFGRLIRRPVLERLAMVNVHFSLLPRWRGAAPVERALLSGDTETGTCLMQLEEGLDTGPVFDVRRIPIRERATADELRRELVELGTEQLVSSLRAGLRSPRAQVGETTYAAKLAPLDFRLDFDQPAEVLDRLVRVGGAWTTWRGKRLRVLAATPLGSKPAGASPGELVVDSVACGGSWLLRLDTVQPEGRAPMAASAWLHGARPAAGERLGSS